MTPSALRTDPEHTAQLCPMPWRHLVVTQAGLALPCCVFSGLLSENGKPLNLHTHDVEAIWNSRAMRALRRDIACGRPVSGCRNCFDTEKGGGTSVRMLALNNYERSAQQCGGPGLARVVRASALRGFRCTASPASLEAYPGRTCNLRCRMCNSMWSSSVAQDAVQRQWNPHADAWHQDISGGVSWAGRPDMVNRRLLGGHAALRELKMLGGESLLIPAIGDIIRHLVDVGAARHIALMLVTNVTTLRPPWLELLTQFERTTLVVSLDGVGPVFEYIRYPAKWDAVTANLRTLRAMPNVFLQAQITVQNYNALHLVDLLRFCDAMELDISTHPLVLPTYLRATNMPPAARERAAERLRAYVEADCRPAYRGQLQSMVDWILGRGVPFDPEEFRTFMLYTNDLDASRGQRFSDVNPELQALAAEAGCPWTAETRFYSAQKAAGSAA